MNLSTIERRLSQTINVFHEKTKLQFEAVHAKLDLLVDVLVDHAKKGEMLELTGRKVLNETKKSNTPVDPPLPSEQSEQKKSNISTR